MKLNFAAFKKAKALISAFVSVALAAAVMLSAAVVAAADTVTEDFKSDIKEYASPSYFSYIEEYGDAAYISESISLAAENAVSDSEYKRDIRTDFDGDKGKSLVTNEGDTLTWNFNVPTAGLYTLNWSYYPIEGNGGSIERRVLIDGALPFSEASSLSFHRLWKNSDGEIKLDTQGNQIMIEQVEAPAWTSQYAEDPSGISVKPLLFYFSAGAHSLTVECLMEPMLLKSISLGSAEAFEAPTYSAYLKSIGDKKDASDGELKLLQGEDVDIKSDQTLYPVADRTSPAVEPYDYAKIVYNTVGGSSWSNSGQWIEWSFNIENSGFYSVSAHYKQSTKDNGSSVRRLLIDGRLPFEEAANWMFRYDSGWQFDYFSDENGDPYKIWLSEGKHTVRMEVGMGIYSDIIGEARNLLSELNAIYRSVIVISGANPDKYRDYKFDLTIPEALEDMKTVSERLKALESSVNALDGSKTISEIKRLYDQLDMMLEDTDTIAVRLTSFKDNIASYGTWINSRQGQPLQIDWIMLSSRESTLPKINNGFFDVIAHYLKTFLVSFNTDYDLIGQTEAATEKHLNVWMTTSRDQANILRQLAINDFTQEKNIPVTVQLVSTKALLPSILADKGPDVTLGVAQSDVNNLALRKAIYRLSDFDDFDEAAKEFNAYALEPFYWNDGYYALPETATWAMLFYRKDIIKELNISTDELNTWDSVFHSVLPKLKKNSLSFGILPTIQNYLSFFYQSGGELYTENGKSSGLDSTAAIESMKSFSALYDQYGIPLSFDFANRFRTGEMPLAVVDFTSYNNLTMFAPEIKGLWGMLPVPGTVREDGSVDHSTVATFTGTAILSSSHNVENAWEFVKWWLSDKAQNSFGKRLESVVGSASRYNTANKNAIRQVRWDPDMRSAMIYQSDVCKAYPEVPGGYYTGRLFGFAFRSIIYEDEDVREAMDDIAEDINREMQNKREEYGLN